MLATRVGSPLEVISAAADGCATASTSTGFSWATTLITSAICAVMYWIAHCARGAPAHPHPIVRRIGRILQGLATPSYFASAGSYAIGLTHRDQCGQLSSLWIDLALWLLLASAILFTVGLTMTTTSEWAAIYAVATLDLGLATLFGWTPIPHRRQIITLLVVHGICTAVAGWWSWRVRFGTPSVRAKGSEAGRTLAAGWITLLALQVGLSAEGGSARSAADTQFLALFIVAAIGIVMGTGYTKYSEARDSLTEAQRLTSSKTWQRARAVVEWSTRYRESF